MALKPPGTIAGIYARVSTIDRGQDPENQLRLLRVYCEARGWQAHEYVDHATGSNDDRPAYRHLMEDARHGAIGVVVVWALDRVTREGPLKALEWVQTIQTFGVPFHSYTEDFFSDPRLGPLLIAILAWAAKWERDVLIERTRAGMARARARGKQIGRPRVITRKDKILDLAQAGQSVRAIAREMGLPKSTVFRRLREAR